MHSSTWLPWLLIGPILIATGSGAGWMVTGWAWLEKLAMVGTGLALLVMAAGFGASWRSPTPVIERCDSRRSPDGPGTGRPEPPA